MLILDYHMPLVSGLDVVRNGRKLYSANVLVFPKVLLLTAIEDPRLKRECLRDDMVDYFQAKPISDEQMELIFRSQCEATIYLIKPILNQTFEYQGFWGFGVLTLSKSPIVFWPSLVSEWSSVRLSRLVG